MSIKNVYEDLNEMISRCNKTFEDVKWIQLGMDEQLDNWDDDRSDWTYEYQHKVNYNTETNDSLEDTINKLKVLSFNDGYGGQELFGKVVFKDGTWLERCEYDGSEWWEYKSTPEFDKSLK